MRVLLTLAMLAPLTACTGPTPVVLKGNESFVTVSHPDHTSEAVARKVAMAYCEKYNKRAALLSDACPVAKCTERSIIYWCR